MKRKLVAIFTVFLISTVVLAQITLKTEVGEATLGTLRSEYQELLDKNNLNAAVEKGAELSEALTINKQYNEARALCLQMENLIYADGRRNGRNNYNLHFFVAKERLRFYTKEGDAKKSKELLGQMQYFQRFLADDAQEEDVLMLKAEYYQTFGMMSKSLECYEMLLQRCLDGKAEKDKEECYKQLIAYAEQSKNLQLKQTTQKKYTVWQDSIRMVNAVSELAVLKSEHTALQDNLGQKEKKINNNKLIIGGLWVLIVALIAAIVILLGLFLRNVYRVRKLKQNLDLVNESNARKSAFISNISSQIIPGIEEMEQTLTKPGALPVVEDELAALKKNIVDMQSFISLEESRDEAYPVKLTEITQLCERIMEKSKPAFNPAVEGTVSAPKISIKTNPEVLEHILSYLIGRAALHTDSGKISLEFKKRNARTGQFIISDTGGQIEPQLQEDIFKPFARAEVATNRDNWGLPICALMAFKLNGMLKIDTEYKKGTRFILDLCS